MSKKKVVVVTDTTACIPEELVAQYGIPVIPLNVLWDGEALKDGVDITPNQFYARLAKSSTTPTTSQPSVGEFVEFFEKVGETAEEIVGLFLSDALSGTLDSARQAKEMVDIPVHLMDTKMIATALAIAVLEAHKMAEEGATGEEILAMASKAEAQSKVMLIADTLEFLHRGGRIGGGRRFVGSLLSVKPVLHVKDGKVDSLASVRTKKKAVRRMFDELVSGLEGKTPIRIGVLHSNAQADADKLQEELQARFPGVPVMNSPITPVVGTHLGPGALGLGYAYR